MSSTATLTRYATDGMEMNMKYFVVCINYPRREVGLSIIPACREAVVDPEVTRREVISRIKSGEYERERISFIHEIRMGEPPQDVTAEILAEARVAAIDEHNDACLAGDLQATRFDRAHDLRKHEAVL